MRDFNPSRISSISVAKDMLLSPIDSDFEPANDIFISETKRIDGGFELTAPARHNNRLAVIFEALFGHHFWRKFHECQGAIISYRKRAGVELDCRFYCHLLCFQRRRRRVRAAPDWIAFHWPTNCRPSVMICSTKPMRSFCPVQVLSHGNGSLSHIALAFQLAFERPSLST